MLQLYMEGLIIVLLGRRTPAATEKSTSLGKGGVVLDLVIKGDNMIVLRAALAMSTWDTSQGWSEEGK